MKFVKLAVFMAVIGLFTSGLTSCFSMGGGSQKYSASDVWGTVLPQNVITVGNGVFIEAYGWIIYHEKFNKLGVNDRVKLNFSLDAANVQTTIEGYHYYPAEVSGLEHVPLRNIQYYSDQSDIDATYGKDKLAAAEIYPVIISSYKNANQILTVTVGYEGSNDSHEVAVIANSDQPFRGDTLALQLRHNAKEDNGTKPYLLYRAYDLQGVLYSKEKAVIEVEYTHEFNSKEEIKRSHIDWERPKETEE